MGCRGIRMIHWVETPTSFMVFCHQTSPAQSLQALKQRLETESTFFQRLQLDRVGVRYWARWVRWIFGKKTGNFTGENGGNWESRLINYGIPGLFTPQRYIFLGCKWATLQAWRRSDHADFLPKGSQVSPTQVSGTSNARVEVVLQNLTPHDPWA